MVFAQLSVILFLVPGAVPPLSDGELIRVAGAMEGSTDRGDGFAALVENVSRWTPGLGDTPVRLEVDPDALVVDPAAARGDLFRIEGTLEQQSWLPAPDDAIAEWFVRDGAGRPILVYVCGLAPDHAFVDGRPVTVPARFYKRVDDRARDGRVRGYAAFVGAFPRAGPGAAGGSGLGNLWFVVVPVAIMLVVFLALLAYAHRGGRPGRRGVRYVPPADGGPPLPDDPAAALAEMRRRAGVQGP